MPSHKLAETSGIRKTLLKGSVGGFGVRVGGSGFAVLLQLLLARLTTLEVFGQYVYLMAWVNLLTILARLGFEAAAVRFIPQYQVQEDWQHFNGYISFNYRVVAVSTVLICLIMGLYGAFFIELHLRPAWFIGIALVPLNTYAPVVGAFILGMKRVVSSLGPQQVLKPIIVAAAATTIYFSADQELSVPQAVACQIVASSLVLIMLVATWKRLRPVPSRTVPGTQDKRSEWIHVALPLLLVAGFNITITQADMMMLGMLRSTTDAGLYSVATKTASILTLLLSAVESIAAPMFAQYHAQGRLNELQTTLTYTALVIFASSAVMCLVIVGFADLILGIFGPSFVAASPVVRILTIGYLISAFNGSVGYLLIMTGHHRLAMNALGATALLNVVLNGALIPAFGTVGAAVATVTSSIFGNIIMHVYCVRRTGMDPSVLSVVRLVRT